MYHYVNAPTNQSNFSIPTDINGVSAVISAVLIYKSYQQVESSTELFLERQEYLKQIYVNLGYGGGIHAFKNYVLRGTETYQIEASNKLQAAQSAIESLKALSSTSPEEQKLILSIQSTVENYINNLETAVKLQSTNIPVREIDRQVKVDDSAAISSLDELDRILKEDYKSVSEVLYKEGKVKILIILSMLSLTIIIAHILGRRLGNYIIKSIDKLQGFADEISTGEFETGDSIDINFGSTEITELGRRMQLMANKLGQSFKALAEREDLEHKIQILARLFTQNQNQQELEKQVIKFFVQELHLSAGRIYFTDGKKFSHSTSWGLVSSIEIELTEEHESNLKNLLSDNEVAIFNSIPYSFWSVNSGMGQHTPDTIVYLPVHYGETPIAIIELAGFSGSDNLDESVLTKFLHILAEGFNASRIQSEKITLLEKSQRQALELEAQQEELKSSNEELQLQSRALATQKAELEYANKQLTKIKLDLEQKAIKLNEVNKYKSEFLANMSHEFRTPLNSLMVLSSLLIESEDERLSEKQQNYIDSIYHSGKDLLTLVEDILDLTKIEERKMRLKSESFKLEALFQELDYAFSPMFFNAGINWTSSLPDSVCRYIINTDRGRLKQILQNLLSNALKFTEVGEVLFSVSEDSQQNLIFMVRDTGVGILDHKKESIFKAFEQEDNSIDRAFGGSGLGLTISRELASLLGGRIVVESEKNIGSLFTLILPATIVISQDPENEQSYTSSAVTDDAPNTEDLNINALGKDTQDQSPTDNDLDAKQFSYKNITDNFLEKIDPDTPVILTIEDDLAFVQVVEEAAKLKNMQSIAINNGKEAIDLLNRFIPDAILLDIKLPQLSGLTILEHLKSRKETRHIPVHIVSGLDYQKNAIRLGAIGYLTKPLNMEKITAALDRIQRVIQTTQRRVLLIEDNHKQREAIEELLRNDKTEVISLGGGRQGIAKLKEMDFDAIVLDLRLPDTSGLDFLKRINDLSISVPPIVVYTGKDLDREEEEHLLNFSSSIILKSAKSPGKLLDEINLILHRAQIDLPRKQQALIEQSRFSLKEFSGHTILLVDDDMRNVFALTSALENRGFEAVIAKDGIDALKALEEQTDISLVLTDIMMPKMNGFELIRAIRNGHTGRSDIPIVALTARASMEDHEKVISAGADDYLSKPVNLSNLMSVLRVWLPPATKHTR